MEPGVAFRVVGGGAVLVFAGRVSHTNAGDDGILAPVDSKIRVLPRGYGFDLAAKRPSRSDRVEERR